MAFRSLILVVCVQVAVALPQLNVFGTAIQACSGPKGLEAGSSDGGSCTFREYDQGAHQVNYLSDNPKMSDFENNSKVCIKEMPNGFSSSTGQGPWSDQHEGQSWCICIWYRITNPACSLLLADTDPLFRAFSHWASAGRSLRLQCDAISEKVVDSSFAKRHLSGARGGGDYETAVRALCTTCAGQAATAAEVKFLAARCKALGFVAEADGLPAPAPANARAEL